MKEAAETEHPTSPGSDDEAEPTSSYYEQEAATAEKNGGGRGTGMKKSGGRASRWRRQKAAKIWKQAEDQHAQAQALLLAGGGAAMAPNRRKVGPSSDTAALAFTTASRTQSLPSVLLKRQEKDASTLSSGWTRTDEIQVTSQLGYLPGNAIRVSCYESQVAYLYPLSSLFRISLKEEDIGTANCHHFVVKDDYDSSTIPVAVELYPLAIRQGTSADAAAMALPSSLPETAFRSWRQRGERGKARRRNRRVSAAAVASRISGSSSGEEERANPKRPDEDEDGTIEANRFNKGIQDDKVGWDVEEAVAAGVVEPFPTLYWLTHPGLRVAISRLEEEGWCHRLQDRLRQDPEALRCMRQAHSLYGSYRSRLLTESDRKLVEERKWHETALSPESRGVAGIRDPAKVKCLHTHAAHYLSATSTNGGDDNVVGRWVMELLVHHRHHHQQHQQWSMKNHPNARDAGSGSTRGS